MLVPDVTSKPHNSQVSDNILTDVSCQCHGANKLLKTSVAVTPVQLITCDTGGDAVTPTAPLHHTAAMVFNA